MAHKTLVGGTAYGISGGKCLIGGTAYSIKKGRTLVGGTGYDISFGKQLASYAEGDVVRINENGSPFEFYVAKHDYESDLNGFGRTLVVRKEQFGGCPWNTSGAAATWSTSYVLQYLNDTFKSRLSEHIVGLISTTSYPHLNYYGAHVSAKSDPIFLLSRTEMGHGGSEGEALPIATILSNYPYTAKWTRSPATMTSVYYVSYRGELLAGASYFENDIFPVFTLPSSVLVGENDLIA